MYVYMWYSVNSFIVLCSIDSGFNSENSNTNNNSSSRVHDNHSSSSNYNIIIL